MRLAAFAVLIGWTLGADANPVATAEFKSVLGKTANPERGAELFRTCSQCHGPSGGGSENGDVPRIAGQHFAVLVRQLVDYRHNVRWDIRMEHYSGRNLLSDEQSIADVAAYINQLPSDGPRNVGDGSLVPHGRALYARRCARCHGPMGEGSAIDMVPRLAGQHFAYLLRQMHDAVDGRRPNIPQSHVRVLAKLDRDDLVGVADFLAREEWSGPLATPAGTLGMREQRD
jgi:cytochrome c553